MRTLIEHEPITNKKYVKNNMVSRKSSVCMKEALHKERTQFLHSTLNIYRLFSEEPHTLDNAAKKKSDKKNNMQPEKRQKGDSIGHRRSRPSKLEWIHAFCKQYEHIEEALKMMCKSLAGYCKEDVDSNWWELFQKPDACRDNISSIRLLTSNRYRYLFIY